MKIIEDTVSSVPDFENINVPKYVLVIAGQGNGLFSAESMDIVSEIQSIPISRCFFKNQFSTKHYRKTISLSLLLDSI